MSDDTKALADRLEQYFCGQKIMVLVLIFGWEKALYVREISADAPHRGRVHQVFRIEASACDFVKDDAIRATEWVDAASPVIDRDDEYRCTTYCGGPPHCPKCPMYQAGEAANRLTNRRASSGEPEHGAYLPGELSRLRMIETRLANEMGHVKTGMRPDATAATLRYLLTGDSRDMLAVALPEQGAARRDCEGSCRFPDGGSSSWATRVVNGMHLCAGCAAEVEQGAALTKECSCFTDTGGTWHCPRDCPIPDHYYTDHRHGAALTDGDAGAEKEGDAERTGVASLLNPSDLPGDEEKFPPGVHVLVEGETFCWIVLGTGQSEDGKAIALLGAAYHFVTEQHASVANRIVLERYLTALPSPPKRSVRNALRTKGTATEVAEEAKPTISDPESHCPIPNCKVEHYFQRLYSGPLGYEPDEVRAYDAWKAAHADPEPSPPPSVPTPEPPACAGILKGSRGERAMCGLPREHPVHRPELDDGPPDGRHDFIPCGSRDEREQGR